MFHNKNFFKFTLIYIVINAMAIGYSMTISFFSGITYTLFASLSYGLFFYYTRKRYCEIRKLSTYLQVVYQGRETFDVRDYCEGDVSILKSDLYKITCILKQQAKSLQKDKSFLANSLQDISHQLKTPLTSMMVMSDLIQEDLPTEKRQEFIQLMQIQLKRIEWLVSSLLKMSKIDANAVTFHYERYSLNALLEHAVAPLRIPMEIKEQQFSLTCNTSIMILADENWIIEAFSNILKNCMEHTPQHGHITITCIDNPLHTQIEITDDGEGMDEEDKAHVFKRFYRGKNASSNSAGIGLSLSKTILKRHNADIQLMSEPKKGTTFQICFYK